MYSRLCGFYSNTTFDYLEEREEPVHYIMAVPMRYPVQRRIASENNWLRIDGGIDICEFSYQGEKWEHSRRMIAVRQKIQERPCATGKQLSLFGDEIDYNGYRYSCYITNLPLGAAEIWRLYRGRANSENRIKELKYDYGLDKMNQTSFDGTEATLVLMTIAYNLMSLFRQVVMTEKVKHRLATLRYKFLAIPSLIEKNKQNTVIKMAVQMKRRLWIQRLWKASMAEPN
ncbi:MAG: transposase, partial [Chitinispirillales bacterium]|nr:transposase [Chitinispirillales bacterium]